MFNDMLALGAGGGGGKIKYDSFTLPTNAGSSYKVSVDCGFQPKQIMIQSGIVSDYNKGFTIFVDTEDTTRSGAGYGNGYWYSNATSLNPNTAITITPNGFDIEFPSITAINYIYGRTAYFIAIA